MRAASMPAARAFRSALERNSATTSFRRGRCVLDPSYRRCGPFHQYRYSSAMASLVDRSCPSASGPDAATLLQSLLTNDVEQAQPGGGVYALLLTPKARVIADIELFNVGDRYVLACPPGRAGEVLHT